MEFKRSKIKLSKGTRMELRNVSSAVEPIIKQAGHQLLSYFLHENSYKEKEGAGFVTEADLAIEEYLIEQLRQVLPGSSVIGEEHGNNDGTNEYCWVIDPLDGTTNFIRGLPYFCISVALTYKGSPQFGAVYQPLTKEYFYAIKGQGAFLNDEPLKISDCRNLGKSVIVIGFPYKKGEQFDHLIRLMVDIAPKTFAFRHFGAAALDLAYIAAGRLDGIFFEDLAWWDVAAGMLLIQEAGGLVTTFEGDFVDKSFKTFVAACPELHQQLKTLLMAR